MPSLIYEDNDVTIHSIYQPLSISQIIFRVAEWRDECLFVKPLKVLRFAGNPETNQKRDVDRIKRWNHAVIIARPDYMKWRHGVNANEPVFESKEIRDSTALLYMYIYIDVNVQIHVHEDVQTYNKQAK